MDNNGKFLSVRIIMWHFIFYFFVYFHIFVPIGIWGNWELVLFEYILNTFYKQYMCRGISVQYFGR